MDRNAGTSKSSANTILSLWNAELGVSKSLVRLLLVCYVVFFLTMPVLLYLTNLDINIVVLLVGAVVLFGLFIWFITSYIDAITGNLLSPEIAVDRSMSPSATTKQSKKLRRD